MEKDDIPRPPAPADPATLSVKERHRIAIENQERQHHERVQQIKNDPSRQVTAEGGEDDRSQRQGIQAKWQEAHARALQLEAERYEATKAATLSQFQPLHGPGYVKSQAEFFQRLILMCAPTLWSINRTIARAFRRLRDSAATGVDPALRSVVNAETGTETEIDGQLSEPQRVAMGSTHVHRPNRLSNDAARLFRDALLASRGRPQVLLCGVYDESPDVPPPLEMTAVAIVGDDGHVYVALTIAAARGQQDNPAAYGAKRFVVFSEDGATPVLEVVLDVVPSTSAEDLEEEPEPEPEPVREPEPEPETEEAAGTLRLHAINHPSLTNASSEAYVSGDADGGARSPASPFPPGYGQSTYPQGRFSAYDDGNDTEDEDDGADEAGGWRRRRPADDGIDAEPDAATDDDGNDNEEEPTTFLSAVGTVDLSGEPRHAAGDCRVSYGALLQFSSSVLASPVKGKRGKRTADSSNGPDSERNDNDDDEEEEELDAGAEEASLPEASSRRIRPLDPAVVTAVTSSTKCLVLQRGGDVGDAVVFTGTLKSALTAHPSVTDTKLLVAGDSLFEWRRGAAASGWMYKWPLHSQQSGRRTRRFFVLRNSSLFYFKEEPTAQFPRAHLSFRSAAVEKRRRPPSRLKPPPLKALQSTSASGSRHFPLLRQKSVRELPQYDDVEADPGTGRAATDKTGTATSAAVGAAATAGMAAVNSSGRPGALAAAGALTVTRDSTVGWGVQFMVPCVQLDTPFDTLWMNARDAPSAAASPTASAGGSSGDPMVDEEEDEGELSYVDARDGRLALRGPPRNRWIRELSRAIALDRRAVSADGALREGRHPLLMTHTDKLVSATWNHESSDFVCVAVDAVNPPRGAASGPGQLLYQHATLFCLRSCTPCSAAAAGDDASSSTAASPVQHVDGRGQLQWFNMNSTYSVTIETRYAAATSAGAGPRPGHSLLKESLKVANARGGANLNSELTCVALVHVGSGADALGFSVGASVLSDGNGPCCCVVLAGSHGFVAVGVPRMRAAAPTAAAAAASDDGEEEVMLVCVPPQPPRPRNDDAYMDCDTDRSGSDHGDNDNDDDDDDDDDSGIGDEDDVRRLYEERAARATAGRGHGYEANITCLAVARGAHDVGPSESALFASGDDQGVVSLWNVVSAPTTSDADMPVTLQLQAVLDVAKLVSPRRDSGKARVDSGAVAEPERVVSMKFLPNDDFLVVGTNRRLLLVLVGRRQRLDELHWRGAAGTGDDGASSSETSSAAAAAAAVPPRMSVWTKRPRSPVGKAARPRRGRSAPLSFLSWVELDRVPPGCEGIFSMALEEEGPASPHHPPPPPRAAALWKVVLDTERRPQATLSNHPLNIEGTVAATLRQSRERARSSFSALLALAGGVGGGGGGGGGTSADEKAGRRPSVSATAPPAPAGVKEGGGIVSSLLSAFSSSRRGSKMSSSPEASRSFPPAASAAPSTAALPSAAAASAARLASRGGFRSHTDDAMAISLDLHRGLAAGEADDDDDGDDNDHAGPLDDDAEADCRVFRFKWTDAMFEAAIAQLKVITV